MKTLIVALMSLTFACSTSTPVQSRRSAVEQYLSQHSTTPRHIAEAMIAGHVLIGMNGEQVMAAIGSPIQRHSFPKSEAWLYSAALFHQSDSSHGATIARVAFLNGSVMSVDFY